MKKPIGIFDSGLGGLTVANAVKNLLPNEKIIYFGDTAHLPYGDKSADSIRYYSQKITDFLLEKNCKVILIACNTASAHAFEIVKNYVKDKAIVMNVIEPLVDYLTEKESFDKIGVIGTKGTIKSQTYVKKINEKNSNIEVFTLATPLLVPMIEEGFIYDDVSTSIIRSYLSRKELKDIQALILACTHYPIIKNQIRKFYDFSIKVIDASQIVANKLKDELKKQNLLEESYLKEKHDFFVSDYTNMFEKLARIFFEDEINLKEVKLWEI